MSRPAQIDLTIPGGKNYETIVKDLKVSIPPVEHLVQTEGFFSLGFKKRHDPEGIEEAAVAGKRLLLEEIDPEENRHTLENTVWPVYSSTGPVLDGDRVEPNVPALFELVEAACWFSITELVKNEHVVIKTHAGVYESITTPNHPRVIDLYRLMASECLAAVNITPLPHPRRLNLLCEPPPEKESTKRGYAAFSSADQLEDSGPDPEQVERRRVLSSLSDLWDPSGSQADVSSDRLKELGTFLLADEAELNNAPLLDNLVKKKAKSLPYVLKGYQRLYVWSGEFEWWWDTYTEHLAHYSPAGITIPSRFGSEYLRLLLVFSMEELATKLATSALGLYAPSLLVEALAGLADLPLTVKTAMLDSLDLSVTPSVNPTSAGKGQMGLGFSLRDASGATEEREGILSYEPVYNDKSPSAMMHLVTLKNIFSRQLPKMPREYIAKLVFDPNHRSFCILKNGRVSGGVCYRPFYDKRFAEIAFLAVTSTEQVRGYGTRLMNHLKEHVKRDGIDRFLTYADNFAVGYFRKQGFSSILSQSKESYSGYIKDYDVATLMECNLNNQLNYLKIGEILTRQKDYLVFFWKAQAFTMHKMKNSGDPETSFELGKEIHRQINERSEPIWSEFKAWQPFKKQPGLTEADLISTEEKKEVVKSMQKRLALGVEEFRGIHNIQDKSVEKNNEPAPDLTSVTNEHPFAAHLGSAMPGLSNWGGITRLMEGAEIDILGLKGLEEANWTPWAQHVYEIGQELLELKNRKVLGSHVTPGSLLDSCNGIMTQLIKHTSSWPFRTPVSADDAPDYHIVIKKSMDFMTMKKKIKNGEYLTAEEFEEDVKLVFANCRQYNDKNTPYYKSADTLEAFVQPRIERLKRQFRPSKETEGED